MIARLNMGGPARCVIRLASGLVEHGFDTLVATGKPDKREGDMSGDIRAAGSRIEPVPGLERSINPVRDLFAYTYLKRIIRSYKPQIVHTHTAKAGLLGRLAACRTRPRPVLVHTFHGHVLDSYFSPLLSAFFRSLERRMARRTDALIAVSGSVRDELVTRHRVGAERNYRVIPSGFPELDLDGAASLRGEFGLASSVVAGCIARMVPIKGIFTLLDAVPRILRQVPGLKIVLVGDGRLRPRVDAYLEKEPWKGALMVPGNRSDLESVLKTLDILVLPSFKEGLPTVLLEAAAAGVAVAASRIPGVTELFVHEKNALLFEPGSVEELARAVVTLARDEETRQRLAEAAKSDIPAMVPGYLEVASAHSNLYKELLARREK